MQGLVQMLLSLETFIVVGEEQSDISPFGEEGKAYVFNINGTLLQNLTPPHPSRKGSYGSDVEIQNDIIIVSESSAEVDGHPNSGRIQVYQLGVPIKAQDSGEEETPQVSNVPDSEPSGGIPGFPVWSMGVAILLCSLFLAKKHTTFPNISSSQEGI